MGNANSHVVIAAVNGALGIKGWVKVTSFTEPKANILAYKTFYLGQENNWRLVNCESVREHGKDFALKLKGCDDRNQAETYKHLLIAVDKADLPTLAIGDYYWHQLQGLMVKVKATGQLLGAVSHLLETGSNDVLVVKSCDGSIDDRERLLPYRPEFVLAVDLSQQLIEVDWDADF